MQKYRIGRQNKYKVGSEPDVSDISVRQANVKLKESSDFPFFPLIYFPNSTFTVFEQIV